MSIDILCASLSLSLCVSCFTSPICRFFFNTECCVIFRIDGLVPNSPDGVSTYTTVTGGMKKEYRKVEDKLRSISIIKEDEEIVGVVEEVFYGSTLQRLEELAKENSQGDRVVPVESVEMYKIIVKMGPDALRKEEAMVSTKYKTVDRWR